ncbi:MAG TPA: hypothetical protein VL360_01825 [Gammaproteobacteria bacterium]|nr:hypothetical protein [Gammaproteobacteria bacterium]
MRETRVDASNNQGFVLLIMLIFMQMVALLIAREISMLAYLKQSLFHHVMDVQQENEMQAVMRLVDHYKRPSCMINHMSHSAISNMSLRWWLKHGCKIRFHGNEYFFVREYLGVGACIGIRNQHNQVVVTEYYRNTLLYHSDINELERQLMQDTVAIPGNNIAVCSGQLRLIESGRKMLKRIL